MITWIFEEDSFSPIAKIKNNKHFSIVNDHLGTPIEGYDDTGALIWERQLNANGKIITQKGIENFCPFLYQGQSFDNEIELAYNRFRYYDVEDGRYISQDPIGLDSGEFGFYNYVEDTCNIIDVFGLSSTVLNTNLGGVTGDGMQAHHLIPEQTWGNNSTFLNNIGLSGQRDAASNGVLLHDSEIGSQSAGKAIWHRGSHANYSDMVNQRIRSIEARHRVHGDDARARAEIADLQRRLRRALSRNSKGKHYRVS
ncbi:RHS repeat-associated core domain-containing protein [Flavobacterium branchiophilum]|uniref:RHS repeat domain-containing protein n=1 Tax=Flavobacterium branchiophilum TaxID=55197 RepID=UPI00030F7663|nr:RHS repeat-associated core domain-containing protein [Flavobacterium branchiophilum]